jgi:hypothetical protein
VVPQYPRTCVPLCSWVLWGKRICDSLTPLHLDLSHSLSRHRFRLVTTSTLNLVSKLLIYYSARLSYINLWCQSIYLILLNGPKWAFDWLGSGTGAQEVKNPPSSRRILPTFSPSPRITARAECIVGVRQCRSSLHPRLHDAVRTNRVLHVKSLFVALVITT